MSNKQINVMPSQTAILTAFYKAIGNKEFSNQRVGSDHLAKFFLPFYARYLIRNKRLRKKAKDKFSAKMPGVYEYVLARTVFFDEMFISALDEKISQIVLLGAGYDTRAYRFTNHNKSSRIFELDNEATQDRKKKLLKKFKIKIPELVTYISTDFNRGSLEEALSGAGYKENEKTLFIWEGVCMYLEPESVDAIFTLITQSSHKKSTLAFDYVIPATNENIHNYYGAEEIYKIMKNPSSNESFRFTIDENMLVPFLSQRGFKTSQHLDHTQIEKLYLSLEEGVIIGQPNGMFRLAIATLN